MTVEAWFPMYPGDFLGSTDVALMTTEQIGAFCLFLMHSWKSDPPCMLPNDDRKLRILSKMTEQQWAEQKGDVLKKFKSKGEYIYNSRLYSIYEEQQQKHVRRVTAGKLGGRGKISPDRGQQPAPSVSSPITKASTSPAALNPVAAISAGRTDSPKGDDIAPSEAKRDPDKGNTRPKKESAANRSARVFTLEVERLFSLFAGLLADAGHKIPETEKQIQDAKDTLRLMIERDQTDPDELEAGIVWAMNDTGSGNGFPGWRAVTQSIPGFRAKWPKIRPQMLAKKFQPARAGIRREFDPNDAE